MSDEPRDETGVGLRLGTRRTAGSSITRFLRHGLNSVRLKTFGMLASAVVALGGASLAAWSGNASLDTWFWMPVVWGGVMLVGVLHGIARDGLPEDAPAPPASGDVTRDLTAAMNRWQSGHDLPLRYHVTGGLATISAAIAGLTIAMVTGEVFLGMPFSWWAIGMVILASIGAFELLRVRRTQDD